MHRLRSFALLAVALAALILTPLATEASGVSGPASTLQRLA
jgi:hypothetical protein